MIKRFASTWTSGDDFNMAVNGPIAAVLNIEEFMTPGNSPLWGIGGPDEAHAASTGFVCFPLRPYHWCDNKHGCHEVAIEQLCLAVRHQGSRFPVLMHLWVTNLLGR